MYKRRGIDRWPSNEMEHNGDGYLIIQSLSIDLIKLLFSPYMQFSSRVTKTFFSVIFTS